jgi:mannose-6-phosphate isomerase-like protein (cupin superfamily)
MTGETSYSINMDLKFKCGELIDVPQIVAECDKQWFNQSLCEVNQSVVRLAIIKGEFHWHKHDREDKFFFVLGGKLLLDLDRETVEIGPHQGYTVARGVLHRTRAMEKTVVLLVENAGVIPTGD